MLIRGRHLPLRTYRQRRDEAARLTSAAFERSVPILLLANPGEGMVRDTTQDPWFAYYTGCLEPGAALLIDPTVRPCRHTLFLDPGDPKRVVWDGQRLGPSQKAARLFGIHRTLDCKRLEQEVTAAGKRAGKRVAFLWRTKEPGIQTMMARKWRAKLNGWTRLNAEPVLVHQRMVKDADEVAWTRQAIARTEAGLKATLPRLRQLRGEAEIANELTMHYRKHDNAPLAFPPIVGSGVHGATLHYPFNDQPLQPGAPILIDSGATAGGYCADVTRTVPHSGTYRGRFREVYELVLSVNELVARSVKPGMTLKEVNDLAWEPITKAGFTRHHGIGHHLGMDVHDPADRDAKLLPGMMITDEPGIYLPKDGFGIRIEDDLLITETGCEVLTRKIPKRIDELESLLAG